MTPETEHLLKLIKTKRKKFPDLKTKMKNYALWKKMSEEITPLEDDAFDTFSLEEEEEYYLARDGELPKCFLDRKKKELELQSGTKKDN